MIGNPYFPNDSHDWPLNKAAATNQGSQVPHLYLKESEKGAVHIVIFSDIHFGALAFNRSLFEKYLKKVEELNAYIILAGDLFEVALPSRIEHSVWELEVTTDEQYQMGYRYFSPFKDRILMSTSGNHDARVWKKTGFDLAKNFAKDMGCHYNKNGGYLRVGSGPTDYTFAFFHGYSGGSNPFTELEKRMAVYDQADVLAMGNNHHLGNRVFVKKRIIDGEEVRWPVHYVRTGSFLSEPEYSREALYAPTLEGAPIISLNSKTRAIKINVAGETDW